MAIDNKLTVLEFMTKYSVNIDKDMFGSYFAYDTKGIFTSPSLEHISEVCHWLYTNMANLIRKLE